MVDADLPSCDPSLTSLFERERARTLAPSGSKKAALARITARLAAGAAAGTATKEVLGPKTTTALATSKSVPALLLAFALGGAAGSAVTGAALHRTHDATVPLLTAPRSAPSVTADAPPAPPPSSAPPEPTPVAETPLPPPGSMPTPTHRPPPTAPADRTLEGERRILDRAQMALIRGEASTAISAAEEHRARFPGGQLEAEREALLIQALVLAHRDDDARARAARFRARYPNSVFRRVVELAIGGEEK